MLHGWSIVQAQAQCELWLKSTSRAPTPSELLTDTLQAGGAWALRARLPALASLLGQKGTSFQADNFLQRSLNAGGDPHCTGRTVSWHVLNVLAGMLGWCIHREGKELLVQAPVVLCEGIVYQVYQVSLDPPEFCL